MTRPALLKSASVLILSLGFAGPALAEVDVQAFTAALTAQMAANGYTVTLGGAEADGDDVVLSDIKFKVGEMPDYPLAELRLQDVSETEHGYMIGEIEAPGFTAAKDGKTLEFGGASIENLAVPGPDETDPVRKLMMAEKMTVDAVKVSDASGEIFSMDGLEATYSPYEPGKPIESEFSMTGLKADMTKLPDPKAKMTMEKLGYSTLTGEMIGKGIWDPSDGRMEISQFAYRVNEAANLTITMDIRGLTPALITQAQELNLKKQKGEINEQAMGFAMLGLMQQLSFANMSIRIDDASLTGRVLEFVAAQQGVKPADVANMAKGVLPMAMAKLQNPAFSSQVSAAVGAYLDDPKSLTITAAPEKPVPFTEIMGAGMGAPQTIPDVLGVKVEANTACTQGC